MKIGKKPGQGHRQATVTWNGCERPVVELARQHGIAQNIVYTRLRAGWTVHQALTVPVGSLEACRIGRTVRVSALDYPLHALAGAALGTLFMCTIRQQLELIVWLAGLFQ